MNYGVLISNEDVFIILNDKMVEEKVKSIENIKSAIFINNQVIIGSEKEIIIPIINMEDRRVLSQKEGYISIIDEHGKAVKIIEIETKRG